MKNGFTLIELLVVVLIIGILAAIALPQYQVAVGKARYAELMTLARKIYDAEHLYKLAEGEYSADFSLLDIEMPLGGTFIQDEGGTSVLIYPNGNEIRFNGDYVYGVNQTKINNSYVLYLEEKKELCYAYQNSSVANSVCKSLGGILKYNSDCGLHGACNIYTLP